MYKVFEIDYHDRAFCIGRTEDIKEARKIARKAFKESSGEYPVFIEDEKQVVFELK